MSNRSATVERNTRETQIKMSVNLDGSGICQLNTGVPFLEHMLEQVSRHGLIDLNIQAAGDLQIDAHHTVEDIGITFGQCLEQALGSKKGIQRYAHAYVPLDESLTRIVLDLSGRPGLSWNVNFPRPTVGGFDVELFQEFFQGMVNHAKMTLHADTIRGVNNHHIAETLFKALGRALRMACSIDAAMGDVTPSTKGSL